MSEPPGQFLARNLLPSTDPPAGDPIAKVVKSVTRMIERCILVFIGYNSIQRGSRSQ